MFGVKGRFKAAAPVVGLIMVFTLATLNLTRRCVKAGLVPLPEEVFTDEVVVTETVFRNEARAYMAPVGTAPPAGIKEAFGSEWDETFRSGSGATGVA